MTVPQQTSNMLASAPAVQQADQVDHLVTFRMGGQLYALPLAHVERVLRMVAITPVPEAPRWVCGVVNFHGRVLPVVDLRPRLGHAAGAFRLDNHLLIVQSRGQLLALIVDQAEQMQAVPRSEVQQSTEPLSHSRPLAAVCHCGQEMVLVLDAARLLPEGAEGWHPNRETDAGGGEDLSRIRGIGAAYKARLRAAGIHTLASLAESKGAEVAVLLGLPPGRLPTVLDWIEQAVQISTIEGSRP